MKNLHAGAIAIVVFVAVMALLTAKGAQAAGGIPGEIVSVQNILNTLASQTALIPPAWSQILPASQRFVLVMGGAAVLDEETGLVWEQAPGGLFVWTAAVQHCLQLSVGNRLGWRLPSVQELASLVDPTQPTDPRLPEGHPFSNVSPTGFYWSVTTAADFASFGINSAWVEGFFSSSPHPVPLLETEEDTAFAWCVRGGKGPDIQ